MPWLSRLDAGTIICARIGLIVCGDWLFEINGFPEWRSSEGGADNAFLFATGI